MEKNKKREKKQGRFVTWLKDWKRVGLKKKRKKERKKEWKKGKVQPSTKIDNFGYKQNKKIVSGGWVNGWERKVISGIA